MELLIVAVALLLIAFYVITLYNNLVKARTLAEEGFSGIDVQLKRRADLIPNHVETVKGYMDHEKGTLENITALRAKAQASHTPEERFKAEAGISGALANILAVAENYPQLRASDNFVDLQNELSGIEEQLQMARRYYNGTVRDLNVMVEQFPGNIIAGMFRFEKKAFFEIDNEVDRQVQKVSFK